MKIETFDLLGYLDFLGIPYWEAGAKNVAQGWVGIQCIYCDDNHNHLGVNLYHKAFHCWKCDSTGSILRLIQDLENVAYRVARDRIDEYQTPFAPEPQEKQRLADKGQDILPTGCGPHFSRAQRLYLRRRRFNPDDLRYVWGVQAGPFAGDWKYRIIIPVVLEGRPMTWIGLDHTGKRSPKYLAADTRECFIPASELVYGADYAGECVVVVEGVTDAWRMGPGAVAMLGMEPTAAKIDQLLTLPSQRYYIMFDGGEAQAARNADAVANHLVFAGRQVEVIDLEDGDPADMTNEQAAELRDELGIQ